MSKLYLLIALFVSLIACSRTDKPYDEKADANAVIEQAAAEAKQQNKPMVIIFGANWCPDCRALDKAIAYGKDATKIANEFKIVKVNIGHFDKNTEVANAYGNPISGGIPGAAVLSSDRQLIYVTKPGELSNAMRANDSGVYTLLTHYKSTQTGILR